MLCSSGDDPDNMLPLHLRYHEAGAEARARVLELLRGLSTELQTKINVVVFASMILVIAKGLFCHLRCDMKFSFFTF